MAKDYSEEELRELQQIYMEMQGAEQQVAVMKQQIEQLDEQIAGIAGVSQEVAELGKVKAGTSVLVPVASGIFAKATLDDSAEMLVGVGAGVVVGKNISEVRELLAQQSDRVVKAKEELAKNMDGLSKKSTEVQERLRKLVR